MSSNDLYNRARKSILDKDADYVSIYETKTDLDASILEVVLMGKYKPKCNKCKTSKSMYEATIEILEPQFTDVIDVHSFMLKHNLPSIIMTKIHRALSYKIVEKNEYNRTPSAIICKYNNRHLAIISKSRANNIFLDMLQRNSKYRVTTSLELDVDGEKIEFEFEMYAKMYEQEFLVNTVGYNEFIPFNEAFSFDMLIVDDTSDFIDLCLIFEKKGLKIWN